VSVKGGFRDAWIRGNPGAKEAAYSFHRYSGSLSHLFLKYKDMLNWEELYRAYLGSGVTFDSEDDDVNIAASGVDWEGRSGNCSPSDDSEEVGDYARKLLSSGNRRVLIVNTRASDGIGDEIIKLAPITQGLLDLNPDLTIVLYSKHSYLYSNPRIETRKMGGHVDIPQNERFDMVVNYDDGSSLSLFDIFSRQRFETYLKYKEPPIKVDVIFSHDMIESVDIRTIDGGSCTIADKDNNRYGLVLRICKTLKLPIRSGIERPRTENSIFTGSTLMDDAGRDMVDSYWVQNVESTNSMKKPVAVFNGFGGEFANKGYEMSGEGAINFTSRIRELIQAGYFIIVLSNNKPYGILTEAKKVMNYLDQGEARSVLIGPPADLVGGRLYKHIVDKADLIVTVEGGLMHLAYSMGKPFIVFQAQGSGSFADWAPTMPNPTMQVALSMVDIDHGRLKEEAKRMLPMLLANAAANATTEKTAVPQSAKRNNICEDQVFELPAAGVMTYVWPSIVAYNQLDSIGIPFLRTLRAFTGFFSLRAVSSDGPGTPKEPEGMSSKLSSEVSKAERYPVSKMKTPPNTRGSSVKIAGVSVLEGLTSRLYVTSSGELEGILRRYWDEFGVDNLELPATLIAKIVDKFKEAETSGQAPSVALTRAASRIACGVPGGMVFDSLVDAGIKELSSEEEIFLWSGFHNKGPGISNRDLDSVDTYSVLFNTVFTMAKESANGVRIRILDVGCGPKGAAIRELHKELAKHFNGIKKADCFGIDFADIEDSDGDVTIRKADVRNMPFHSGYFDLIYDSRMLYAYDHSPSSFLPVIQEVMRVLRPGGKFIIIDPCTYLKTHSSIIADRLKELNIPYETKSEIIIVTKQVESLSLAGTTSSNNDDREFPDAEREYRQVLRRRVHGRERVLISEEGRTFNKVYRIEGTPLVEKVINDRPGAIEREAKALALAKSRLNLLVVPSYIFHGRMIQEFVYVLASLKYPGCGLLWQVSEEYGRRIIEAYFGFYQKVWECGVFDFDLGLHNMALHPSGFLAAFDFGLMQTEYPDSVELNAARKTLRVLTGSIPLPLRSFYTELSEELIMVMYNQFYSKLPDDNDLWDKNTLASKSSESLRLPSINAPRKVRPFYPFADLAQSIADGGIKVYESFIDNGDKTVFGLVRTRDQERSAEPENENGGGLSAKTQNGLSPETVKEHREALGITLADISAETGISPASINRYERGVRDAQDSTLSLIYEAVDRVRARQFRQLREMARLTTQELAASVGMEKDRLEKIEKNEVIADHSLWKRLDEKAGELSRMRLKSRRLAARMTQKELALLSALRPADIVGFEADVSISEMNLAILHQAIDKFQGGRLRLGLESARLNKEEVASEAILAPGLLERLMKGEESDNIGALERAHEAINRLQGKRLRERRQAARLSMDTIQSKAKTLRKYITKLEFGRFDKYSPRNFEKIPARLRKLHSAIDKLQCEYLIKRRKAARLTHSEVAFAMGSTVSHIKRVESGESITGPDIVKKVHAAIDRLQGVKLKELRMAKGLTQEELAGLSGVDLWIIKKMERIKQDNIKEKTLLIRDDNTDLLNRLHEAIESAESKSSAELRDNTIR
ncbi:MAG: helix-turn-helix domain-containing protein, partial [Candidatus Omnitrophica bacterium]|nr:helix-turn-helix domain-containing protein [Candidatus Omnitrophota bacterium]